MSTTTMLQLVQQVTAELGLPIPATVAGNPNQDVVQILALMNASGYELQRRADWRELTKQHTFYTEAISTTGTWSTSSYTITGIPSTAALDTTYQVQGVGIPNATYVTGVPSATSVTINYEPTEAQVAGGLIFQKVKYGLPSDYYSSVNRTHWDKSKRWEMLGPESPQQWEWLLSGYISTGPRIRYRLLGKYFQIWPGMNAGELLGFEYRSNAWAESAAGVAKTSLTADTDTCIYPDRVMVLSTKLKYFEAKGFDTTAIFRDYVAELETAIAQVTSFNISGIETETYDSRTLDGTAGVEYDPTGYVEGGSVTFDVLYDPALAGHQNITDLAVAAHMTTNGLPNDVNWKVKFANTAATELTFVSAGIGVDITGEASDGLRGSFTLKCDGCPALPS